MKHILILIISCFSITSWGQDSDSNNYVSIHTDERLNTVVNTKPTTTNKSGFVGRMKGFRVQIYSGNDRTKANQAKMEFMKAFPGVRSYITYHTPQFKVRVGDFKTRQEAGELYHKTSAKFNPCMIVPDVVNINSVRKPKEENKNDD